MTGAEIRPEHPSSAPLSSGGVASKHPPAFHNEHLTLTREGRQPIQFSSFHFNSFSFCFPFPDKTTAQHVKPSPRPGVRRAARLGTAIRTPSCLGPQQQERTVYTELRPAGSIGCCHGDCGWEKGGWADGEYACMSRHSTDTRRVLRSGRTIGQMGLGWMDANAGVINRSKMPWVTTMVVRGISPVRLVRRLLRPRIRRSMCVLTTNLYRTVCLPPNAFP